MIFTELKDCQIEIFNFIRNKQYWGVFAEYGIGKSLIALQYMDETYTNGRVLIIGKKKNTEDGGSWTKQIEEHTDFKYVSLTSLPNDKRRFWLQQQFHGEFVIYLLNYDSVQPLVNDLIQARFDFVLFDESTEVKSSRTHKWKACKKLVQYIPERGILTGTPITERLMDLWSQIYLLDEGESLSSSYFKFLQKYFYKFMFNWQIKREAKEKLISKISSFCISRTIDECIDLPKRTYITYPLEPTLKQKKMEKELLDTFSLQHGDIYMEMQHILPVYAKLRQIASGFLYSKAEKGVTQSVETSFHTPKDEILLEILEMIPDHHRVIIWCEFSEEIHKIWRLLTQHYHDSDFIVIHKDFDSTLNNLKDQRIILSTPAVLGAGETILAKYAIRYGHDWSYERKMNAQARNYRRGSEKFDRVVYIDIFIKDSIEELVLKNASKKNGLVKSFKEILRRYN